MRTTTMATPVYSLHHIEQARAVAAVLHKYVEDNAPDTNEGEDWTTPEDYNEVCVVLLHLDAAIEAHDKQPKSCKWCGSGFVAPATLCGRCRESREANLTYNATR